MNSVLDRFETKFTPEPNSGCWLWVSNMYSSGYGAFWFEGRERRAHRIAWQLYRGDIPVGAFVCHRCDMPQCVNPDHLFLGSPKTNMSDKVAKGRHQCGENSPHAILSETDVKQIKELRESGMSMTEIGKQYGVTKWAIYNIFRGKNWASV